MNVGGGGELEGDNVEEVIELDYVGFLNSKVFEFCFEMENFRKVLVG